MFFLTYREVIFSVRISEVNFYEIVEEPFLLSIERVPMPFKLTEIIKVVK